MSYEIKSNSISELVGKTKYVTPVIRLHGNTVAADVRCESDTSDIIPYVQINGVQPSVTGTGMLLLADAGANFPALDSTTDPTVWGLLLLVGNANPLFRPIVTIDYEPTTVTLPFLVGTSNTGVTADGNIAVYFSTANSDLTTNTIYPIQLEIKYRCLAST